MKLRDMLTTLRTHEFERVEIRDFEGNELFTCPVDSEVIIPFKDCDVSEWFPHGAPHKDATFTVYIRR